MSTHRLRRGDAARETQMKPLLNGAATASIAVVVLFSSAVSADELPTNALSPVIVTATRSAQSENRLPATVTVITHDDIVASAATRIVDVLRGVAGAQITDFYGDGSQATVDLRGFGSAANATTLILVDGRRLNNTDIASPDLSSISLKDVERIEILHGSAGTLYGDQAVGGVINIITRNPDKLAVNGEVGGGSYGGQNIRASVANRIGAASFRLSGEARGADNYRDHNHDENENLLGRGGYDYGSGSVFLELGYVNQNLQTPGALFANEVAQDRRQSESVHSADFSQTRTGTQRINWRQSLFSAWSLETDLSHRRSTGTFRLSYAGTPATSNSTQDRNQWSLNPRVSGGFALPAGRAQVTVGIDAQHAEYALRSPFGLQTSDQRERDFYAQTSLPLWRTLVTTVGARTARVDNVVFDGYTFTQSTPFSDTRNAAEAGLSVKPMKNLRLYARYDSNFRFAKVDEFTSAGAPPASNTNPLKSQHGATYEVGSEWNSATLQLSATLFRLQLHDEIVFDPTTFANVNLDHTRRDGVTLDGGWQVLTWLKLSGSYSYINAQVDGGPLSGKQVPLVARQNGRFAIDLQLPQRFNAHIETLATGPRSFDGDFDNTLGKLSGYAVTNLALGKDWNHFRVSARVNNVLGREYSEYGSSGYDATFTEVETFYPSPGRNYWLSVAYSL